MPEGDTVWLTARGLHEALAGRVLTRSDFRVPRYATTDLTGRSVTECVARGKHLLTRVDGGVTVHTHLRMDGSWRIRPAGDRTAGNHRIRLVLANDTWQAVGYQLGIVEVLPTAREARVVGHLGPDLLGPDWDPAEAARRLRAVPARAVGEVAGLDALVSTAQQLMDANKERFGQVTTGVSRPGEQMWVYGRAGRPCRRCGTAIRSADQGGDTTERVTFWCPRCQS